MLPFSPYLFNVACVDRRHPLRDQPGPKFPASDHRPAGAGGRVAVPPAGWVSDSELQRGPAALLSDGTTRLKTKRNSSRNTITLYKKIGFRIRGQSQRTFWSVRSKVPLKWTRGQLMSLVHCSVLACIQTRLHLCSIGKERKKHSWNWTVPLYLAEGDIVLPLMIEREWTLTTCPRVGIFVYLRV